jgi:isoleucyl-tRNA synthetase
MEEIDRWALHRLQEVIRRVRDAYDRYQFHVVYHTLHNFCAVDLSALYLDVLKDRIYTAKAASKARRSGQTAMYLILEAMTRLLAPMLTFTAEEIWAAMPAYAGKAASVHLTRFPEVNEAFLNPDLSERWKTLIAVKGEISKAIEIARKNKVVGHPLDAAVSVCPPEKLRPLLDTYLDDLRALLIVSQVRLVQKDQIQEAWQSAEFEGLTVGVSKAGGRKCSRCWIYNENIGTNPEHPTVCERCLKNLDDIVKSP